MHTKSVPALCSQLAAFQTYLGWLDADRDESQFTVLIYDKVTATRLVVAASEGVDEFTTWV